MYTKFYGLAKKPFALTPDPAAVFMSETHQEGLAILETLADVSRQLPAVMDAVARSAEQKYRWLSERAAAAGQAAAGAARAFGNAPLPSSRPRQGG